MSDIDPEKLEVAIKIAHRDLDDAASAMLNAGHLKLLVTAARAHLATLPRWKEVEVVRWGVLDHRGDCFRVEDSEKDARSWLASDSAWSLVRLTGTAKVRA